MSFSDNFFIIKKLLFKLCCFNMIFFHEIVFV